MNGQELINAVYERTAYRTDDPQVTRTRILGWLNAALRAYQAHVPGAAWLNASTTVATTPGTQSYALSPANAQEVRRVTWISANGERRLLERISLADMDGRDPKCSGWPRTWAYEETTLYVWPVPDEAGTLEVDYTAAESALADSTGSSPQLPAELHDLLIDHAVHLAHLATGNQAASAFLPVDHPQVVSKLRRANAARKGKPRPRRNPWGVW